MTNKSLIKQLNQIGVIKFGRFKLKSGMISPIYIDLRILVSYPRLLKRIAQAYGAILAQLSYDRLAGVPYAALPIAGAISLLLNKPWLYTRKEQKDYGLKKPVEGEWQKGETVVVIDDLITTGLSKLEIIKPLEKIGLKVKDVVVLIDREQGGKEELQKKGYALHAVFSVSAIIHQLFQEKKISALMYTTVNNFLGKSKIR